MQQALASIDPTSFSQDLIGVRWYGVIIATGILIAFFAGPAGDGQKVHHFRSVDESADLGIAICHFKSGDYFSAEHYNRSGSAPLG